MPKYKIRPRADDDVHAERIWRPESGLSVFDHEPVPTGVLDKHGQEFWRDPEPIGFNIFETETEKVAS